MRFILRSTFWLSIVYASILWPNHAIDLQDGAAAIREGARSAGGRVLAGATDLCQGRHAVDCIGDAARLTTLLARMTEDGRPVADHVRGDKSASGRDRNNDRLARAP